MGIGIRISNGQCHPVDQQIGRRVLEALRLFVNHVPGKAQPFNQVALDHPVSPDDAQRVRFADRRKSYAVIGHVGDEAL